MPIYRREAPEPQPLATPEQDPLVQALAPSNAGTASRAESARAARGHTHDGFGVDHDHDADGSSMPLLNGLRRGSRGDEVLEIQEWLVRVGRLPAGSTTGVYDEATLGAIQRIQDDAGIERTADGEIDDDTAWAIDDLRWQFRAQDRARAQAAAGERDLRDLSDTQADAAWGAMVPRVAGRGGSERNAEPIFVDVVDGMSYRDRLRTNLLQVIDEFHESQYASRVELRQNPEQNFHAWPTLDSAAGAARDACLQVYGSYLPEAPQMSSGSGALVDLWQSEEEDNATLPEEGRIEKAGALLRNFLQAYCAEVHSMHGAITSRDAESAIVNGVLAELLGDPAMVERLLQTMMGWGGMQSGGQVFMQRFREPDDAGNRAMLWDFYETCVHEYMHLAGHEDFFAYVDQIAGDGESTRVHTLTEGFCEYFTFIVRSGVSYDEDLRRRVEGPYYDPNVPIPEINPGAYQSLRQAQAVADVVGHDNCAAAYFLGDVSRMVGRRRADGA